MPSARRSISGPAVLATWVVTDRWHPAAACRATRARLPAPPPELARGPAHPPARPPLPPPPPPPPPADRFAPPHPPHPPPGPPPRSPPATTSSGRRIVSYPATRKSPAAPFYGPLVCPA